jgi:Na+-transporting NADH:ubiquinone oxidoreductase subunit C
VQSRNYTFIFAAIVIVVAALLLSSAATLLKERQDANVAREKKSFILKAVGVETEDIDAKYNEAITEMVIDEKGNVIEGVNAFALNMEKQSKKKKTNPDYKLQLPVYVFEGANGVNRYVFPVTGKGLWGPIWGYVSLKQNMSTIYTAIFDHKGETPGLGAEISAQWYQEQFKGKEIYNDNGELISIDVLKGAGNTLDKHSVDGVSGGTITSVGLEKMLEKDFNYYLPFLEMKRKSNS